MRNILVLCLGNLCRSPIAEILLQEALPADTWSVSSAGIHAPVGETPPLYAQEVMKAKRGIDISQHRAKQVTLPDMLQAELILVMEKKQQEALRKQFPVIKGKVMRLGEWSGYDIADPYQRPKLVFEQTFLLIEKSCKDWIKNLK